ncbi:hypothetical protein IW140_001130 [Coemansia sp. RSA 1813]|nr:hypothetical protein EV178_002355 [Coemansia sp. RSA 1646]KAJ1773160.1 hypothetical protein LPJ74_000899 [Coemansia sp. RSA 1843]KAJ2092037.1 hypothetical protein IW138_001403 [Coemansia sp. RSA 986]KAJ2216626.1 hypothetical protein EV179_001165 [Coemansia sp. RSA 487]KAJ2572090.1 hypothetical protein IW140_001130 [Coemansia sp. RSA 1813]
MKIHRSILMKSSSRAMPRDKTLPKDKQLKKWKVIKGDTVMVITGKDRGKIGQVTEVSRQTNRVYVKGMNLVFKSVPKSTDTPDGKLQKEMPIHISNVNLVDPSTNMPTKVSIRKFTNPETGLSEMRRYTVSTGTYIPKNIDMSYQKDWKDGPYDSSVNVVHNLSFDAVPGIPPFPSDVMREIANRYKKTF